LLELSTKATEARGAALLVAEEESGDLVEYVYDATAPGALTRIGVKAGEGLAGRCHVARTKCCRCVRGRAARIGMSESRAACPFRWTPRWPLPLEGESAPLGAVALFGTAGSRAFTGEDESLNAAGRRQRFDGRAAVLRQPGS